MNNIHKNYSVQSTSWKHYDAGYLTQQISAHTEIHPQLNALVLEAKAAET